MSIVFSDFIRQKNLESPAWVLAIDDVVYFSTIPLAALPSALPIISSITGPALETDYTGGTAKVSTLTVTLLDIFAGSTYKASSALYSADVIGKRCVLYLGDSTATTWSDTYYRPLWIGYVREAAEKGGKWELHCEDSLSLAKNGILEIDESFLTVAEDFQARDSAIGIKGRRKMPTLPTLVNLAINPTFDTSMSGWTWDCTGGSATWGSSYGRSGGGVKVNSGASNTGALTQTVPLPSDHKQGHIYCALIDAKTDGTPTATRYQLRVQMEVLDSSGAVLEVATGTARKVRHEGEWGTYSASIAVYHPSAASIRVKYIVGTDGTTPVSFDHAFLYRPQVFITLKREVYAALSIDESTTPDSMAIAHAVLSTRENTQPKGEKGKVVYPFVGYGADIILRLLTTTSTGGNGPWDHGDGLGCGIPIGDIDTASFIATRAALPYHLFALLLVERQKDVLGFIAEEILKPMGAWLTLDTQGRIRMGYLPDTVGVPTITITDASIAERKTPSLERQREATINRVDAFADYDYMGACETRSSRELGHYANHLVVDSGGPEGDSRYIGTWTFDENDYRIDGVFMDQNRTSQSRFGVHAYTVKSKGLRGLPSYSSGMPCPLYNWGGSNYRYAWQGEEALRSLATRLLTFFSVPPCFISHAAFAEALAWEIGDVASLTLTGVPNPTGGRDISAVKAILVKKEVKPGPVTVALTWLVLDPAWYSAPISNQPVYDYGTAPSAANIDIRVADADTVKAGNFPYVLSGKFAALIVTHQYGGVTGAMPNFNAYAYTEVRIQWNSAQDSHTKGLITTARFKTSKIMVALPGALAYDSNALEDIGSIQVLWRYRDGTYSTAYIYGSATPGSDIEDPQDPVVLPHDIVASIEGTSEVMASWNAVHDHRLGLSVAGTSLVRASWANLNDAPSTPTIGTLTSTEQDIPGTRRVECDLTVPLTFSGAHKLHVQVKEWDGSKITANDSVVVNVRGKTSYTYYRRHMYTKGRTLYVRAWAETGTALSAPTCSDANWETNPPTGAASVVAGGGSAPSAPAFTGLVVKTRKPHHTDFQAQWSTASNAYKEIEVEITYDGGTTWEPVKVVNIWAQRLTGKARIRIHHQVEYEAPQIRLLMRDKYGQESSYYPSATGTDSTWWASIEPGGGGENPVTKWPWTFSSTSAFYDASNKRVEIDNGSTARLDVPLHKQRIAMHGDWSFSGFSATHKLGFLDDNGRNGYYIAILSASQVQLYGVDNNGTATAIGSAQILTSALAANTTADFRFEVHRSKIVLIVGTNSQRFEWTDATYRTKGWKAWFIAATGEKIYLESLHVNNGGQFYNGLATSNVQAITDADGFADAGSVQATIAGTKRKLATMMAKVGGDIYFDGSFLRERDPVDSSAMPTTDLKAGMLQPFYYSGGTGAAKYRLGVMIPANFFGDGIPSSDIWAHFNADNTMSAASASTPTSGSGGSGGTCFRGDMLVLTPDGPMPISDIQTSAIILSVDQQTGKIVEDYIVSKAEHDADRVLLLNGELAVTEEHFLFRWDRGRQPASCPQITAGEAQLGCLLTVMGETALAPRVLEMKQVVDEPCKVYSLTTGTKCFLIGSNGRFYLVHNLKNLNN